MATFETYNWRTIICIEDPVHRSYVDKDSYFKMFLPLLETFDGSDADSYITEFFATSPVNPSILTFVDEDSRLDFQYLAIDMGLIPQIKEIFEGETAEEKLKRKEEEMRQKLIKKQEQRRSKRILTVEQKNNIRMMQMAKTLDKLTARLSSEENPAIRERLNKKIQRIEIHMRSTTI